MSFAGKVAVVTGGASGIGFATAGRLVAEGASVVITDLNADAGPAAAEELGATFIAADVASSADWARVVDEITARFGRIDLAHLNAGVNSGVWEAVDELTDAQYRRIMGANLDGAVFGVRALMPVMTAGGGGAIVATASLAGLIAFSPDPIYTATKHAVVGLVRALGPVLQPRRITINAVCPGITDTPLVAPDAKAELLAADFPIIEPAAIADAVVACMRGGETGQAYVCQAGREPVPFVFRGVPGPRAAGAEGRRPPAGMGDPDA